MRVLLTGATGFLGNNLLRLLLEDKYDVTVTVRPSSNRQALDGLDVECVDADLGKPETLVQAAASVDLIIHAAAMIHLGWTRLDEARRINVESTRALAEAARRHRIRMIHVSTVDTLACADKDRLVTESDREPAKPPCTYVVSKREAEEAFYEQIDLGLDGLVVHPGFMLGPWDWKPTSGMMIQTVCNNVAFFAPPGGCSVADVRDVACGILSAIEHGRTGENYILGGENLTFLDLWTRIAEITGSRKPFGVSPRWLAHAAGRIGDGVGKLIGKEPLLNSANVAIGNIYSWYSSEKAQKELGYRIGSADRAIEDSWKWLKAYGYIK